MPRRLAVLLALVLLVATPAQAQPQSVPDYDAEGLDRSGGSGLVLARQAVAQRSSVPTSEAQGLGQDCAAELLLASPAQAQQPRTPASNEESLGRDCSPGPLLARQAVAQQPGVPVSDEEVVQGDPNVASIALAFNVGAGYTPATAILDTLAEQRQHVTFFVMGWWAEQHPDVLRQIAAGGHEIGSHGHSIFDLTQASDAQVRADLEAADAAISAVTGRTTRPLWSPSAGYRDARVRSIAASLGYRPILWTVDAADWSTEATPESVYSHIVNGATNGAIIVLHFDSPTTVDSTAQVLPAAIESLRSAGYRLVTVTDLLTAH